MESPEQSPEQLLEQQFTESLEMAVFLFDGIGEGDIMPLDPITLGMSDDFRIETMNPKDKGDIGRAIWNYYLLPKGKELVDARTGGYTAQLETDRIVNVHVYPTGQKDMFLHEALFPDGQKRFALAHENTRIEFFG